jgi:hypothetical protein
VVVGTHQVRNVDGEAIMVEIWLVEEDLALRRARGALWLPRRPLTTLRQAGAFVARHGFALLFPAHATVAPSLWEAVAGEDAEPFATGMGDAESRVWTWKDELPRAGLAWSGKFLYRRASLLSRDLLALLYVGRGEPTDHRSMALSRDAHDIAEALIGGALSTSALREHVGGKGRYDKAISELHRNLLVTSAGTVEQRAGWPAVLVDLTCRRFDVGGRSDPTAAAERFVRTAVSATPRDLSRAYGWSLAAARAQMI